MADEALYQQVEVTNKQIQTLCIQVIFGPGSDLDGFYFGSFLVYFILGSCHFLFWLGVKGFTFLTKGLVFQHAFQVQVQVELDFSCSGSFGSGSFQLWVFSSLGLSASFAISTNKYANSHRQDTRRFNTIKTCRLPQQFF